jgi:hypothetical protein
MPEDHAGFENIDDRWGNMDAGHVARAAQFRSPGDIVAVTAIIGGIVLFGSTRTTASQISAAIRGAEERRTKLISKLELRTVEEGLNGET